MSTSLSTNSLHSRHFLVVGIIVAVITVLLSNTLLFLTDDAGTADVLVVNLLEITEKFALIVVHVGLLLRGFNDAENAACLPEDSVHLFQRALGSLGVEEVDHGEDNGVTEWMLVLF